MCSAADLDSPCPSGPIQEGHLAFGYILTNYDLSRLGPKSQWLLSACHLGPWVTYFSKNSDLKQ